MKHSVVLSVLLFIAGCMFFSCSSAPKNTDEQTTSDVKNQAAEYAGYGDNYFNRAQYDQALKFFEMALKENISVNNEEGIVKTYNSIGKVYMAQGLNQYARSTFTLAYELAETLEDNILISRTENNIGELFLRNGQSEEALEMFVKAIDRLDGIEFDKKDKESNQKDHRPILYHNTGQAYKQQGDLDNALSFLQKALTLNLEDENYKNMADNYYALASVHSKKGMYPQAEEFALLALENDKIIENSVGIAKDLLALGFINEKADNPADALVYYKKSYLVHKTLNLSADVKRVLRFIIDSAETAGSPEDVKKYTAILESLETSR